MGELSFLATTCLAISTGWRANQHGISRRSCEHASPDDRRRYNLAHELGHLLMRCEDVSSKEEEKLANRFASALLVPASVAKHELGKKRKRIDLNELAILKLKYGFSMQGWVRRAFDLEIIDAGQYKTLCVMFSRNHWKKIEPTKFVGNEAPTL